MIIFKILTLSDEKRKLVTRHECDTKSIDIEKKKRTRKNTKNDNSVSLTLARE